MTGKEQFASFLRELAIAGSTIDRDIVSAPGGKTAAFHCLSQKKRRQGLGGEAFGASTERLIPTATPSLKAWFFGSLAEEVMARLVNILIPSVRDAQEWLGKTELPERKVRSASSQGGLWSRGP